MSDPADQHCDQALDRAWSSFRARLADALAELDEGGALLIDTEPGAFDAAVCSPYVWFHRVGAEITTEAVSNHYLHEHHQIDEASTRGCFDDFGWRQPDEDHLNYHHRAGLEAVDRVAVAACAVLREVYAVRHPAFLLAEGLQHEPGLAPPQGHGSDDVQRRYDQDEVALPGSSDELVELVDSALSEVLMTVEHDDEGDVAVRAGRSVLYVRVLDDRPCVEFFAELVSDAVYPDRLPLEIDILNRTHELAKFYLCGDTVTMSYRMVAWPFVARQLSTVLARLLEEVDAIAETLALRVGGRRFLEEPEPEPRVAGASDTDASAPSHASLIGLLELIELGPVSSPAIGALFEHDRGVLIEHLVGIRTGRIDCGEQDPDYVLHCLRRGLRYVVDGEIPQWRGRGGSPRPEQARLPGTGDPALEGLEPQEESLDLGWSA